MKELSEIYQGMLSVFEEKTGLAMTDTADLAVRLYAAAAQIQSLYVYADWALNQSFPQTATGRYLDYHGQLRGIGRKEGQKAVGLLRFRIDTALEADLPIAAGTVCTTPSLVRFVTTEAGTIPAGSLYADVSAEAEAVGASGNAAAQTVIWMTKAPTGVAGVTNPAAFAGGSDAESDEALRGRILDSFIRLPNGANAAFYELRALSHQGAEAVQVIPRYQGIGTVAVVVAGKEGPADETLLQEIREDLEAVREIAVDVTVMAPQTRTVNVTGTLSPLPGVTFQEAKLAAETALRAYFTGALLGEPVYRARLGQLLLETGKIDNYSLSVPGTDVAADDQVLPVLGAMSFAEATV